MRIVRFRVAVYRMSITNNQKEMLMTNTIKLGRRLLPVEQIALIEPFDPATQNRIQTDRDFKARIVLLDRESVLTEDSPGDFAQAHRFRELPDEPVFTNPDVHFLVEVFRAVEGFNPTKPYLSRLVWRDLDGNTQSKLLLGKPEDVLAIAVRGNAEGSQLEVENAAPQSRPPKRRTQRRSRPKASSVQPA